MTHIADLDHNLSDKEFISKHEPAAHACRCPVLLAALRRLGDVEGYSTDYERQLEESFKEEQLAVQRLAIVHAALCEARDVLEKLSDKDAADEKMIITMIQRIDNAIDLDA